MNEEKLSLLFNILSLMFRFAEAKLFKLENLV